MATDFTALLEELQNNLPTHIVTSDTLKNTSIHVINPNSNVNNPNAEYYNSSTGVNIYVTEHMEGAAVTSVSHEVSNLSSSAIHIEGDSSGYTYVSPFDNECIDSVYGPSIHNTNTNTGHFTTSYLYFEIGPKRSNVDILHGNIGNDVLDGKTGTDTLYGEGGNDILRGGTGNDSLYGGAGKDILFGQEDNDILYGESSDDYLDGGAGNDTMYGGEQDDLIIASAGSDVLLGGTGNDTYLYTRGDGSDTIHEYKENLSDVSDALFLSGVNDVYIVKFYDDLMFLFSLDAGDADSVTIKDWYAGEANQGLEYVAVQALDSVYATADLAGIATDLTPSGVNLFNMDIASLPTANIALTGVSTFDVDAVITSLA